MANGQERPRLGRVTRRRLAPVVAGVLAAALLQGTAAVAGDPSTGRPAVEQADQVVAGHPVKVSPRTWDEEPKAPVKPPAAAWPVSGQASAVVPAAGKAAARVGDLPVVLRASHRTGSVSTATHGSAASASAPPGRVQVEVEVAGRAAAVRAGVDGMLLSLRRADTGSGSDATGLEVDYGTYAQAYGGDYGSRLRLVELPACALTTPSEAACRRTEPLPAVNDSVRGTLTADAVTLPAKSATVLGVTAGASGDGGDYTASKLSQSATWDTDLNTGDFAWSYQMSVPAVPGGLSPTVGLSYSSGGIDGETGTSNNQSSWVGDGFDMWPGYIERGYKSCADDGVTVNGDKPRDLCWGYDNATLSLNGHAGELIPAGTDTWKLRQDDGTRIERLTGSASGAGDNGDNNMEYWRVTTTDGVQYYFGEDKLPGWTSGKETTDSAWTAPVFGDDSGEPCHASTFAASWCQQAWRWNLDYVVDPHGDAIAYYYDKEGNSYGRASTASDDTPYTRGGTVDRIEYGLRSDTVYSAKPLAKVTFHNTERCIPDSGAGVTCAASTIDTKSSYWYDTPWDQNCTAGTDCTGRFAPTFWTRKRLSSVTTSVLNSGGTYTDVDTWALTQRWGMSDIDYQLLLDSVVHTGDATPSATGPAIPLPPVSFGYTQRPNRLDRTGDDTAPFIKERLSTISDESGGQTDVAYSTPACDADSLPTPQTNTTLCYPDYFTASGDENPSLQWFNKYVVASVTQSDRTHSSPDMVTRYDYRDDAAWHYDDDDGLTKEKYKTWSQWRGYGHVRVETGGQTAMDSQTDHYFLRGMDGDRLDGTGGTRSVTVDDGEGTTLTDTDALAGFEYRTEDYSAPGGSILDTTVNHGWYHRTASRNRPWGTTTADLSGTDSTFTYTSLDDGAGSQWRKTALYNTHEDVAGRVTEVDDLGDITVGSDDRCTRTLYADNTTENLLTLVSDIDTVSVDCDSQADRSKQVVSDIRTAYDGSDYAAAPTKGDATYTATLASDNGTTGTYLESGATYDGYGRQRTTTDITADVTVSGSGTLARTPRGDGLTTTTAYTPATGSATTSTVTTPPAVTNTPSTAQTTTTALDPVRGLPLTVTDPNGKRTDYSYDTLGRTLGVWLPDRPKAGGGTPDYQYNYADTDGAPVSVSTRTIRKDGTQETSYVLYDGFLRPRQTQAPGTSGGRLLTDTFYDERGLTAKTFATYYSSGAPSGTLLGVDDATGVDTQTWHTYDGLGRETRMKQTAGNGDGGKVLGTTTSVYGGDRVTVTPPTGATPTTTLSDAHGWTTELWQYHSATPTGAHDTTRYTYTPSGRLHTLTDPSGSVWTYTYDQTGNVTRAVDPDKGTTDSTYDDRGQLLTTKDNRGTVLAHVHDNLGRQTEVHQGTATGVLLDKWVYDTVSGAKGQLASSTSYDNGNAYTSAVNAYDSLYRVTRSTTTIPAAENQLQGAYQVNTRYNPDGTVQSTGYPAAGALPAEVLVPTYDADHRPIKLDGNGTYLTNVVYSRTGRPEQYETATPGNPHTWLTETYEDGTQWLQTSRVDRENVPGVDRFSTYHYDDTGDVLSIEDTSRDGTDNQCFRYDVLQRLKEAWAQGGTGCADTPSASVTGGPAPYWQSFGYDTAGDRTSQTDHDPGGNTAADVNSSYAYPPATGTQPHAVTEIDTNTSPDPAAYAYDEDGDTTSRPAGNGEQQKMTWNAEGRLATVTQPDGSGGTSATSYVYDPDGNRLIQRTPAGTTLYLSGEEITLPAGSTTPTAIRYYDLGGGIQAVRTNDDKVSFILPDAQGTGDIAVDATTSAMRQRRTTPFGATRGTPPASWPGDRGFVGGTQDPTGLTHLNAREYDQRTGRFISVDPILDTGDPQSLNGYAYSDNSPVTRSDPSGQRFVDQESGCQGMAAQIEACMKKNRKVTEASIKSEEKAAWVSQWSPSTDNERALMGSWTAMGANLQGEYWKAQVGGPNGLGNACFGRMGCARAVHYLLDHPHDVAGAKRVAATYCVTHMSDCVADAGQWASTASAVEQAPLLLAGGEGQALEDGASGFDGCRSFTASTPVLLADGTTRPIGKIKPGDRVKAADPRTGEQQGPETVTARFVHHDTDLVDVTVRDADGRSAVLHTTANHPFWDDTLHVWIPAGHLSPGHALRTPGGPAAHVVAVHEHAGAADMDNLTVDRLHTYYVLAGTTPILVHNCNWDMTKIDEKYDKHVFGDGKRPGEGPDMAEYQDEVDGVDGFDRYQQDACGLMCGPKGSNVREVIRSGDGAILRLDTSTGRLGIMQNGKITNFFRPDDPLAYMENESGR